MIRIIKNLTISLLSGAIIASNAYAYTEDNTEVKAFIDDLASEGLDRDFVSNTLKHAEKRDDILKLMNRTAEGTMTWERYRKIFIEEQRIERAVKFGREYKAVLDDIEAEFGVNREVILAIMAVETRMGRVMGKHRVIDALSTLSFDFPKRSKFFKKQLKAYFEIVDRESLDPFKQKGSYAGAMGYAQFMPTSYLAYAVDQDKDGKVDIWNNPKDALGSIANYFKKHHWKMDEPIIAEFKYLGLKAPELSKGLKPEKTITEWGEEQLLIQTKFKEGDKATFFKLDDEYFVGLENFYVITRYNHSKLYAMAVTELSQLIKERI